VCIVEYEDDCERLFVKHVALVRSYVLPHTWPVETEKHHGNCQVRIASLLSEVITQELQNAKQEYLPFSSKFDYDGFEVKMVQASS
jgi:hypothetical protein